MEVDILGTKYKIEYIAEKDDPRLETSNGYFDHSMKRIVVGKFKSDTMSIGNLEVFTKKVLRHEIIHAFFYESGLWENSSNIDAWGMNEEMTDWIAIQFPKMLKVFEEVGAL
ncbi:hypothetical protein M2149_000793 [Lachnospiraceae bacterium PFB1-21]